MNSLMSFQLGLVQIFAVLFGIGLLVFIHEFGHFVFAKLFGAKVEKFAFGFGPEIAGINIGETRYSICAIPFGGMVKIPGENIDEATGAPGEFFSLPWYARFTIAFFGPLMNYLLGAILFTVVIFIWGIAVPIDKAVIGEVIENKPAFNAGFKVGDEVLSVDGVKITSWVQLAEIIHKSPGKKLEFVIRREEDKILNISIIPEKDSSGKGLIGIIQGMERKKVTLYDAFLYGFKSVIFQTVFTIDYLVRKIKTLEKPDIAGPIGVAHIIAKAVRTGFEQLLYILAVISVALGLFNLLPIPIVDGGHILFSLIEAVTARPVNKRVMQIANMAGLTFIIFIFLLATYNDILRLLPDFILKK